MVGFFLLPISAAAAHSPEEPAPKNVSAEVGLYARQVDQSDDPDGNYKTFHLSHDDVEDSSPKSNYREMSLMIGVFAKHVDQSDNPNEDLRMVVVSYDNYVVNHKDSKCLLKCLSY